MTSTNFTDNKTKLFFDIETLPCEESDKAYFIKVLRKKDEDYRGEFSNLTDEEVFEKTSLNGTSGRIFCIACTVETSSSLNSFIFSGNEHEILKNWWNTAKKANLFIGHNIYDFDLPFIYTRSYILNIEPPIECKTIINFARYKQDPIFDTQMEWAKWSSNKYQKMDTIAHVLGIPSSKTDLDGSRVWEYYKKGRIEEIKKYCSKDVEVVRQIYYKMNFKQVSSNDLISTIVIPDSSKLPVMEEEIDEDLCSYCQKFNMVDLGELCPQCGNIFNG